ncbi:peptidase C45 acyl-coenzyme A:6-aminopenicillanic acid acyl-transferase [Fusarium subglutinans]|uniref:Peptidase C45 acyl-coenzyme A:6-aminopenicillanic acid acyl-transferase n=1 Tax=Gibberella subglutinans TaxID=42677 RepID=A0A8H5UQ47_GIBSU|nr:peptidase C45 acyl-coenzyme A:6-aminopenicillanic acid acyl-transferase [Fusarium subglutinans]KAF5593554.1 peptidase C45 acyl-coenzyme A:6-aminopenicillanic acid acyl-transferase [Fusarium subglutinans]
MIELHCSGTHYEIGYKHGSETKELVHGSLEFYTEFFIKYSKMSWAKAEKAAAPFLPYLEEHVPHLVEEMRGIADGAGVTFDAILALNARSEIAMGMMDDGCTSLSWKSGDFAIGAQNWDWEEPQNARLVLMHIKPAKDGLIQRPSICLATEAGILSKSGLNSAGVAVLVNAIMARGVNYKALPFHVAIRAALDCETRLKAVARIRSLGLGTSAHLMFADKTGGTSLEFSHMDVVQMEMVGGKIVHTNHFLQEHDESVIDRVIFPDSISRQERITQLLDEGSDRVKAGQSPMSCVEEMLEDEQNFPTGINRKSSPIRMSETLYSFVADLNTKTVSFRLGRPNEPEGAWILKPAEL